MSDLIKALTIFLKYKDIQWPTFCEHDILYVHGIPYDDVLPEDVEELRLLGFNSCGDDVWRSYRFGSA